MRDVVIVDAVRTPVGKRNGSLAGVHPTDLLGTALTGLIDRTGIDPAEVGQVVGGCVSQVGEQSFNVTRTAWLASGLPQSVAATTVDTQCGSSQQATGLAMALIAGGVVDSAIACGVEVMSRVPIGSNSKTQGRPLAQSYFDTYEFASQFEGAERICDKWDIDRDATDGLGASSQQRAARAWTEDRFATQIIPVEAPVLDEEGKPTGETITLTRDEGLRDTTLESLAKLKPVAREDGRHTAATASQISDGAAAVLMMTAEKAEELGLTPLARVVDTCLVGVDPVTMLTGPIDATEQLLSRNGWSLDDLDVVEINEAFASVVLAWNKEHPVNMEKVNPNGGAIALGHPLGATGAILVTKAVHELVRTNTDKALVTMCCGGGLGTGTLLERI